MRLRDPIKHNLSRAQCIDRDIATQKRRPVPVQHHIAQGEPSAGVVGDGQFRHGGLRRQRALEPRDGNGASGTREIVFKQAGQKPSVVFLSCRLERQGAKGKSINPLHQKACPIPM